MPKIAVRNVGVPGKEVKDLHIRLPYEKDDDQGRQELLGKLAQYPAILRWFCTCPIKKLWF
jgi:hypothetical protein